MKEKKIVAKEGYLTLAVGDKKYLEMALNLALSIKLKDHRPICLLHDKDKIPEKYQQYFNRLIKIQPEDLIVGCTNKIKLFKYSPFEKTLFIDADSLLIKNDIDFFWNELKKYHFTVQGTKKIEGSWGPIEIKSYISKMHLPYLYITNSGIMYFDKSEISKKVFNKMNYYYAYERDKVSWQFKGVAGQYQDEPIISTAMAYYKIEAFPWKIDGNSLMSSSLESEDYKIDIFKGTCSFTKRKTIKVSPTICHFCELEPNEIYKKETNKLREYLLEKNVNPLIKEHAEKNKDFFFIQIGANDGKRDFIHNYTSKYKWKGILIEPVKYLFKRLVKNYQGIDNLTFENVAISNKNEFRDFYRLKETKDNLPTWYDLLGSFNPKIILEHKDRIPNIENYLITEKVKCITFDNLIRKYNVKNIDLLQIDAEGYDYEIIKSIDFSKIKPKMIFYEHSHLNSKDMQECRNFLRKKGYSLIKKGPDTLAFIQ